MALDNGLILFDIDGTLLNTGGGGVRAMGQTVERRYGIPNATAGVAFAGRTDHAIWLDIFRQTGLGEERYRAEREAVHGLFVELLRLELAAHPAQLCPGFPELLESLRDRGCALGLLTGNLSGGAREKLDSIGIWDYFPFGAFGDEHANRADLFPVALDAAAAATGRRFAPDRTLVVGDTLHDLNCGRAGGGKVALVATGTVPADTLRSAGADLYHDDYSDPDAIADEFIRVLQ